MNLYQRCVTHIFAITLTTIVVPMLVTHSLLIGRNPTKILLKLEATLGSVKL